MGLKIETWNIAYRKKTKNTFRDTNAPFEVIPNGHKGWYADPFLFDYKGETYLFAEYFSYKLGRGVISVSKYNPEIDSFGSFSEIIREDYHLSYPVVFSYNNHIYMMPECGESRGLFFYKAVDFPNKWEKISVIDKKMRLADTTPFQFGNDLFAFSLKIEDDSAAGELILMKFDRSYFQPIKTLTKDMSLARPGGNVMICEKTMIRVAQNCEKEYGRELSFISVNNLDSDYQEETVARLTPDSIILKNNKPPVGIHTYNNSDLFEVVDIKYYRNSWYRLFLKLLHKG